ncbi:2-hydroxychromene-2-carboxylate isomerase [Acinetobacter wuhouensis]|uniref:2-hydroxychromene-2-carboxylate isomerase n=1 Tax=Acinetobacter wuhouensis TaxID=1879050 RepID=A0A4Q7AH30_9GAMM|nr:2-hydroxychromene-2-carboxylate isomerase [Acinetobacter wuhouensis]RZG47053.1 2-hydroxychromene-2-carboxylate isomerase [Acinetobacter wuhouensis]RZG70030.1 2-hydroxychromene-2-carboxylate isomerase [Acinetobacter wuhouensis]
MKQVEFYFDFGSPYSYVGFYRIQQIATQHQAEIIWKPMLLGGVFKATGNSSPMAVPAKARYSMIDLGRWSKLWNIPVQMNPYFPINTLNLMRLITAVQLYQPENFQKVLQGLFDAMFGQPKNLNDMNELVTLAQSLELDINQVQTWLADDQVKNQLKQVTEEAIERGVFGAPTWFVGDEMYWGVDHLHFVERALQTVE